jgi:hypothetical protein
MRGNIVAANVDSDSFSISMLEKHLQMQYPTAKMVMIYDKPPWTRSTAEIHICFDNQEDAIAFHLSHTGE